jgi:hypothetical protein
MDFYSVDELSPLSTPASSPPASPPTPRSFSSVSTIPCPHSPAVSHSPIRPDSPLLCPHTLSPALRRARSFNKNLRRAASFRAARERDSLSRNNSPACSRLVGKMFTFIDIYSQEFQSRTTRKARGLLPHQEGPGHEERLEDNGR